MKQFVLALLWFISTSLSYAFSVDPHYYNSYWLCSDKHLEPIQPYSLLHDKANRISINYFLPNFGENKHPITFLKTSRISIKGKRVKFPVALNPGDHIMLSDDRRWYLTCVGTVVLKPQEAEATLLFDVTKNSYQCPFVPSSCRGNEFN